MGNGNRRAQQVNLASPDLASDQLARLREIFPQCITEGKIDFDKLRAALGDDIDQRPERYSFSWAGKRDAIRILQTPSRATLKPCPQESLDWDTTQNVFIEGENLEVLKLLYKSYFGRVKMIYIDPPYNTGNDFVYPDNYADPLDTYLKMTGQRDSEGNLLTSNAETSGRYHSAWLSMMYPRLFLARQLLHDDGAVFVSIDDIEYSRLRLLLDELFGEEKFIGTFIWKSRHNVDSRDKTGISSDHEYVVCYGRGIQGREKDLEKYSNPDNDARGPWMSDNMLGLATKDKRPNLHYDLIDTNTGINYGCPEKGWRFDPKTMAKKISEGRVIWPARPDGRPRQKKFLRELQSTFTGISTLLKVGNTSEGTQELRALFGAEVFDFPKPVSLVKEIVKQAGREDVICMDFFAGACPLAQAVLEQNREDGGNRRFIVAQLPEPTPKGSAAAASGYATIADIGKERVRRVVKRLLGELNGKLDLGEREEPEDLGFRVYKLSESTCRPWQDIDTKDTEKLTEQMKLFAEPLLPGWKTDDVIWEVAIKEGYGLSSKIEAESKANGKTVYRVTDPDKEQSFRICLADKLTPAMVKKLNLNKNDLFVCRDVALDDELAANLALQCRLKTI